MYAHYPSALPGQFLTAPGHFISPHLGFPRPPTSADASPTSASPVFFQPPGQIQHIVPASYSPQFVASGVQSQNPASNPQMVLHGGYLPGATAQGVSSMTGYPAAMTQARGMMAGMGEPHLVSKQPWGVNPVNPGHVEMMRPAGVVGPQRAGQAVSIEENVEKQIDKLSSRRPKRARRANYNLKAIVPDSTLDKTVGVAVQNTHNSPASHKPASPRSRAKPKAGPVRSSAGPQTKQASPERTASKSAAKTTKKTADEGETKPKKKRKRNPETTSHYRGVSWNKANKSWKACIKVKGKNIHIGYFGDDVDAAKAYDMIAQQYRGSSAKVNFQESRVEFSRAVHANLD